MHLPNPFKKREEPIFDPITAGYTQGLINGLQPLPANEEQSLRDLEINIHAIEDVGVMKRLDNLSVTPKYDMDVPIPDGLGGYKIQKISVPSSPVGWALACRIAISEINATRFLTKKEAMRQENWMRSEFLKIKRDMRRCDREVFGHAINQLESMAVGHIHDSVDGQKMLALKTSGKSVKVGVENKNGFGGK